MTQSPESSLSKQDPPLLGENGIHAGDSTPCGSLYGLWVFEGVQVAEKSIEGTRVLQMTGCGNQYTRLVFCCSARTKT
jgi:hypothetical protein